MKRLLQKLPIWPVLLFLIIIFICFKNYSPNTWLTGWDTLHPEFNFSINFKNIINGVWREDQGLGALAGHAHMSELPRIIFLYISSLVLPINFLRYFFFFVSLVVGPLGVYFFIKFTSKELPAFLGGLFYLLNLGTLQHFYVPFEMFAVLYALLPWLLLLAWKFLENGGRKNLILFSVLTIFSASMAYASALWFVYFGFFLIFTLFFWLFMGRNKLLTKRGLILIFLTVLLNSYWLLPNLYFLKNSAENVSQAKINLMFSEKAFDLDEKYATIASAALLKGFLFDWQKYEGNKFSFLLEPWIKHLSSLLILVIGYFLFVIVILGIISALFKKEKISYVLLPCFVFTFIFLIHGTVGISVVFSFLRERLDIFKEALRFPWTKFSIPVIFIFSIFFSFGIERIISIFPKKIFRFVILGIFTALLCLWMKPAFSGQMISPKMRINIPEDYFKAFEFFNKQDKSERISLLPAYSFTGWDFYRWGFEGAGFFWFGINQPVLTRDFDRWNPNNENYYWEISQAINTNNVSNFEKILEKYQITYLLVDEYLFSPAWPKSPGADETEQLIEQSKKISLEQFFGKLKIYKVNLETPVKDFTFVANNLPEVNDYKWGNLDQAYIENGTYLTNGTNDSIFYPFRSLFTGRSTSELDFEIEERGENLVFKKKISSDLQNYNLILPSSLNEELVFVDNTDLSKKQYFIPQVQVNNEFIEVSFPKINGIYSANIDPTQNEIKAENCNSFTKGTVENQIVDGKLRIKSQDAQNCSVVFELPDLIHGQSYLISVESKNISGKSLLYWLENLNLRRADQELYLPKGDGVNYLIQPPMEEDGIGYALHFDNISYNNDWSINDLVNISVYQIPYKFLTELKMVKTIGLDKTNGAGNKVLVYSQSFDSGWKAFVNGKELKNHVKVNNWENGWIVENDKLLMTNDQIVFVYLPQYLEYIGFGILIISILMICSYTYFRK